MNILDQITYPIVDFAKNAEEIFNFACAPDGVNQMWPNLWNANPDKALEITVKTAVVAFASAALAHLFIGKAVVTALTLVGVGALSFLYQCYKHDSNPIQGKIEELVNDAGNAAKKLKKSVKKRVS